MPRPRTVADEQILEAAATAVGEMGPARLTLAHVGDKIGLAPATLLQRFGSKRGLLLALAAHGAETMPNRIAAVVTAEAPLEALVETLTSLAGSIGDAREFANHLAFLLLDLSDPDFQAISRRHSDALRQAIREVLSASAAGGGLRDGVHAEEAADLVYATYNGALIGWGLAPRGRPGDAASRSLRALQALIAA